MQETHCVGDTTKNLFYSANLCLVLKEDGSVEVGDLHTICTLAS